MFFASDKFSRYDTSCSTSWLVTTKLYNEKNKKTRNAMPLTHAYVLLAADEHFASLAPAFPFVASRQEIRPQFAKAHSLGR